MKNRKGLNKNIEKAVGFKGATVDSGISDTEIAWCSIAIYSKGDNTDMMFTSYTRLRHDAAIDYAIKKLSLNPKHIKSIEVTKIKKLSNALDRPPEPIIKWKIIRNTL